MSRGADDELGSSERDAAAFESAAQSYEQAADEASGTGHQRRVRQFRQSARASLILSTTVGAYGGGWLAGLEHDAAMAVSSALNARGTVQLVVAAVGLRLGLITREGFTILVLVALVTSAMAGPLIRRYLRRIPETPDENRRDQLVE